MDLKEEIDHAVVAGDAVGQSLLYRGGHIIHRMVFEKHENTYVFLDAPGALMPFF